jgi:two-component system sensor histidine kinase HydH
MTPPPPRRWPLYVLGAACVCLLVVAAAEAVSWYGHPVAGMLVDPGGVVSNIGLPGWEAKQGGLGFPDTVLRVDGRPLVAKPGRPRAEAWDEAVEAAFARHDDAVDALVQTQAGVRTVHLKVHRLEPVAWWIFGGSFFFAGALYIVAALVALWASPDSPLSRTFGKVGISTGLLLGTTFDFHTTRLLSPVLFVAFAMFPMSWLALALRLPDDAPVLRRLPWLEKALDASGAFVAALFLFLYWSGRETKAVQQALSLAMGGAFVFLGVTFIARFALARGVRRDRLRALLLSIVPPHVVIGTLVFGTFRGKAAEAISYATLSLFPLATAYAFIRYDLWGSRALLSRILTRLAVGTVACVVAIALGTALAAFCGVPFGAAFLAASFGGATAAVLVLVALGVVDRHLFASRVSYKPTVEQLSVELISITSPTEVARAVERTIRRWLPCELIELSLAGEERLPTGPVSGFRSLEPREDPGGAEVDQITLPVEFGGANIGSLHVGEKAGSALFTRDDIDLLRTIVNQGALALAHAYAYQELEARRREQAAAWRGERAALVETVAAEIAHEIRYPINFFRTIFERHGRPLDAEEFEIGREEVDRLERLVSGLRRMASHRIERRNVHVSELCDRVETLLRDALGERRLGRTIPEEAEIRCDPDQVTQILVNLVANGLDAAGSDGKVGIGWTDGAQHSELAVWDTGPGFEGDAASLFAPWYSTKPKGTGLGLAITHRLVRAHGWSITAEKRDHTTEFRITIRSEDVVVPRDAGTGDGRSTKVA